MPIARRRKTLLYGREGSGKTHAWLRYALELHQVGKRTIVIDTNDEVGGLLDTGPFPSGWEPAVYIPARSYTDIDKALDLLVRSAPKAGELVAVEHIARIWDWCLDHFCQETFGMDYGHYFLQKRAEAEDQGKKGGASFGGFGGLVDWPVIKNMYARQMGRLFGHSADMVITTAAKELVDQTAKDEQTDLYAGVGGGNGWMPVGNKNDPYIFDTLMYVHRDRVTLRRNDPGYSYITTVKDRGRALVRDFPVQEVFQDYFDLHGLRYPWAREPATV